MEPTVRSSAAPAPPAQVGLRADSPEPGRNDFDLIPVATVLVRRRGLILLFVLVAGLIGVAHALLTEHRYVAGAMFTVAETPSTQLSQLGGLGALATSLGATIPGVGGNTALFTAAITSRPVLDRVLDTTITVVLRPNRSGTREAPIRLLDWYEIDGAVAAERFEEGRKILSKKMDVSVDNRSQIITLRVEDRDAGVAAAVAKLLLAELNRFNLETRTSVTRETRLYLERMTADAREQLRQAEDALLAFRERNRRTDGSPSLQLEQAQLQRQIDVRQQVYLQMALQLERARSDEVRDTPVLTVIQEPAPPYRRSWPRRKLMVLLWMVGGFAAAIIWVAAASWTAQNNAARVPSWLAFKRELADARKHPVRTRDPAGR